MRSMLLALALLFTTCCGSSCAGPASTVDAKVRSALDTVALFVDPAYAFAVDSCIARERLVADNVEAGKTSPDAGVAELRDIRTKCHATRRAFDQIRSAHTEAVRLVEAGELERAEAVLGDIRNRVNELNGGAP